MSVLENKKDALSDYLDMKRDAVKRRKGGDDKNERQWMQWM